MSAAVSHDRAVVVALPFAATASLWLVRALPVEFSYAENTLGIVSVATAARYPQQQETVWLLTSALAAVCVCYVLARWLMTRAMSSGATFLVEAPGAVALLSALWLPAWIALPVGLACVAGLVRGTSAATSAAPEAFPKAKATARVPWPAAHSSLLLGAVALALLLTTDFWANSLSLAQGFRDADRVLDGFPFMGEIGQHLAWANALRNDEFHGKDFFSLYGPLYDLGLVGVWEVFGRSIVAWDFYFSLTRVVALSGLLVAGALLLRQRGLILCLPFLVPWISLRSGFAFIGLCFVFAWLRAGHPAMVLGAGLVAGTSLLFSQEFGLAFALVAALAFAVHGAWKPACLFATGAGFVVFPVLAWYAANDALGPMLREIVGYPAYVVAGYAKLPFPSLVSVVPFDPAAWSSREFLAQRIGYGVPVVCIGAALLALPISRIDWRTPLASVRRLVADLRADPRRLGVLLVAVFGMLAFRTALGRSDLKHLIDPSPAAGLLLIVALDRVVDQWRARERSAGAAGWRLAALALLVFHVGFTVVPTPLADARETFVQTASLLRDGRQPVGDANVMQVTRWLQLETEVDEPILFLPNNAAYYYLTNRPSPIRFVMGHQIVTQAHRDEVLAVLTQQPPRYFVWDDGALRVDGLSDVQVFGEPLLAWLDAHYTEVERFGAVSVRRWREAAPRATR